VIYSSRRSRVGSDLRAFLSTGLTAAPFKEAFVAVAPPTSGVYFLYRHDRVIYIGIAVQGSDIRQELEKHLSGAYGPCTSSATAFDFEETRDPVVASREYLRAHMAQHRGCLPSCNEREK
jgi:hypothetical protein